MESINIKKITIEIKNDKLQIHIEEYEADDPDDSDYDPLED